ncbi:hypothetical protein F2P56_025531, partial [Juglans regia]
LPVPYIYIIFSSSTSHPQHHHRSTIFVSLPHATLTLEINQNSKPLSPVYQLVSLFLHVIYDRWWCEFLKLNLKCVVKTHNVGDHQEMEVQRMRQLMLLWSRVQSTRVALVGGNHTAARFCTR